MSPSLARTPCSTRRQRRSCGASTHCLRPGRHNPNPNPNLTLTLTLTLALTLTLTLTPTLTLPQHLLLYTSMDLLERAIPALRRAGAPYLTLTITLTLTLPYPCPYPYP